MTPKMKILLITYLYPPIGGMTPIRLSQFVHYIGQPDREARIDVVTIRPSGGHPVYWLEPDKPDERTQSVTIHRSFPGPGWYLASMLSSMSRQRFPCSRKTVRTRRLVKSRPEEAIASRVNAWAGFVYKRVIRTVAVPDTRFDWVPWGLRKARQLLSKYNHDVIWSFGFPFTSHLVAWLLASLSGRPWVAEYGDPWSFGPEAARNPRWRQRIDSWLENLIIRKASRIVVCTDETRAGFLQTFPSIDPDSIVAIPHGYDPTAYRRVVAPKPSVFRIVYTGIFYEHVREPLVFFQALRELPSDQFEVIIIGQVAAKYRHFVEDLGLSSQVQFLGSLPHDEVARYQKSATVLLSFGWAGGYQIPAKLYEYFGAQRPIVNIQFALEDASSCMLSSYSRGLSVPNAEGPLRECLRKLFEWWQSGDLESRFDLRPVEEMTWEARARLMAEVLRQAVACSPTGDKHVRKDH